MKAIILAGGAGTRLRPVTYEIPKPLLPVKKKPIVNHLIEFFRRHGVSDVGLLVSCAHEDDFLRWRKTWGKDLDGSHLTIFLEGKPSGTFGWLKHLRSWIGGEKFILTNGDELKEFDLASLVRFHDEHKPVATIALVEVPDSHEYGVPVMEGYRIISFLEKPKEPPSQFVSSGLYIMEPEVFEYVDLSREYLMNETDVFPALARAGKLYGYKVEGGRWFDCGSLERWERAMREW